MDGSFFAFAIQCWSPSNGDDLYTMKAAGRVIAFTCRDIAHCAQDAIRDVELVLFVVVEGF